MRRIVLTYIFLSIIGILGVGAQNPFNRMDPVTGRDQFGNQVDPNTLPDNLEDSTDTEIQSLPPKLYMWRLSETLGNRTLSSESNINHLSISSPVWIALFCTSKTTTLEQRM